MRTVTFSNDDVQKMLNNDFVCCYTNTEGDPTAGASFSHAPDSEPGPCGRGAGRQNVQTIFLTPDAEIFHVASGYLAPEDLLDELQFAKDLFAELKRRPQRGKETVVAAHKSRLTKLGFTPQQIAAQDNPLSEMMLSGPNPQDFGFNVPKPQDFGVNVPDNGFNFFQDVSQQRILKDNKFVMQYPLLAKQDFEENPQPLVGRHKSFFGSHSAFNGVAEQVNERFDAQRNFKRK